MKSSLFRAFTLGAFIMLVGCSSTGSVYNPSEIEKKYYKECNPTPPQVPPCGNH